MEHPPPSSPWFTRSRWVCVLVLLWALPASAEVGTMLRGGAQLRLYGFNLSFQEGSAYQAFEPLQGYEYNYASELRVRPELVLALTEEFTAVMTINVSRQFGRPVPGFSPQVFRVDRAYFDYRLGSFDFRIGRQAINFGSGQIWNPVDLVDANNALNFQVEKQGLDTFRASYSLSPTSRLIGLVAFAQDRPITLLRAEALLGSLSTAVMAADDRRREVQMIGLDIKGELEVGFWLESALQIPANRPSYYQVVAGLDYSFPVLERLTLSVQYYRDSSGGTGVENYDYEAALAGERQFLGRQYGSLFADLAMDAVTTLRAAAIYNIEDKSHLLSLGLTRSFNDIEVSLRGVVLRGSGVGEFYPGEGNPLSEGLSTRTMELLIDWRF